MLYILLKTRCGIATQLDCPLGRLRVQIPPTLLPSSNNSAVRTAPQSSPRPAPLGNLPDSEAVAVFPFSYRRGGRLRYAALTLKRTSRRIAGAARCWILDRRGRCDLSFLWLFFFLVLVSFTLRSYNRISILSQEGLDPPPVSSALFGGLSASRGGRGGR
jgi:hypothetical protein